MLAILNLLPHSASISLMRLCSLKSGANSSYSAVEIVWPSTLHYSTLCGRHTVKRVAFGIWKCHGQGYAKLLSGGAYLLATASLLSSILPSAEVAHRMFWRRYRFSVIV
ncbi:hypothetical protein B0T13DRAFT_446726 [Neurospora crassa]|nr:hypothetical protein B0T13DRAFT_446726 [Neurospora crassa]